MLKPVPSHLNMRALLFLSLCLACASHAYKLQSRRERKPSESHEDQAGASNSLKALAIFLSTSNPTAGFNPSSTSLSRTPAAPVERVTSRHAHGASPVIMLKKKRKGKQSQGSVSARPTQNLEQISNTLAAEEKYGVRSAPSPPVNSAYDDEKERQKAALMAEIMAERNSKASTDASDTGMPQMSLPKLPDLGSKLPDLGGKLPDLRQLIKGKKEEEEEKPADGYQSKLGRINPGKTFLEDQGISYTEKTPFEKYILRGAVFGIVLLVFWEIFINTPVFPSVKQFWGDLGTLWSKKFGGGFKPL